jgi:hypothetical protein
MLDDHSEIRGSFLGFAVFVGVGCGDHRQWAHWGWVNSISGV